VALSCPSFCKGVGSAKDGDGAHGLVVVNSVQLGFECCKLPVWSAPNRFCPFDLDRFQRSAQHQTATPSQTFSLKPCRRFLRHLSVVLHRAILLSAASAGRRHTRHCLIEQFTHSIDVKGNGYAMIVLEINHSYIVTVLSYQSKQAPDLRKSAAGSSEVVRIASAYWSLPLGAHNPPLAAIRDGPVAAT